MNIIAIILNHLPSRSVLIANEAPSRTSITLFLPNQLAPAVEGQEHWVQLSPFGDFANINGAARVIQRFQKSDAEHICNEFNGPLRKLTQPLGMPFYIGHPDHPRFKGQPGHEDTRAYGRGKEMAVRHDSACPACTAFANAQSDAAPCQDHGLFVRMQWNDDGARLIANESFHGHSVNWAAIPAAKENGVQVYRPVRVKSAGFTNEPNIPVKPASLANAQTSDGEEPFRQAVSTGSRPRACRGAQGPEPAEGQPAQSTVPPRLKLLAGFKEDDDVTMEEIIAALEKAHPLDKANEADLQSKLARERRAHATTVIDGLLKSGKVVTRDRETRIEELCNAGDQFDEKAAQLANTRATVKTESRTRDLAGRHAKVVEGERERSARFQQLMDDRQTHFPNESYEERFRAVAGSGEGSQLFAQMNRPGQVD